MRWVFLWEGSLTGTGIFSDRAAEGDLKRLGGIMDPGADNREKAVLKYLSVKQGGRVKGLPVFYKFKVNVRGLAAFVKG